MAGHGQHAGLRAVGMQVRRQDSGRIRPLQDDRTGTVAKQHARGAVVPVEYPRIHFRTDDEGFLYFVGRKDDIIKTRGEKVSPKEVENVLYMLDGVREAVVIGVPHPVLGAALKAVLVVEAGVELTAQAVIRHCTAHLEDFMVPKFVEFEAALPKTDTGKISRRETIRLLETQ